MRLINAFAGLLTSMVALVWVVLLLQLLERTVLKNNSPFSAASYLNWFEKLSMSDLAGYLIATTLLLVALVIVIAS